MTITTTERGWPGHFPCADRCAFRRNTLVSHEDGRSLVVSSVGAFRPRVSEPIEHIGADRYYECMVFRGQQDKHGYIDADVCRQCSVDMPWALGLLVPQSDAYANKQHDEIVAHCIEHFDEAWKSGAR
jgi:hypothetical protein